jgi:hypothetical protein
MLRSFSVEITSEDSVGASVATGVEWILPPEADEVVRMPTKKGAAAAAAVDRFWLGGAKANANATAGRTSASRARNFIMMNQ